VSRNTGVTLPGTEVENDFIMQVTVFQNDKGLKAVSLLSTDFPVTIRE
jgi:hypothetical protein